MCRRFCSGRRRSRSGLHVAVGAAGAITIIFVAVWGPTASAGSQRPSSTDLMSLIGDMELEGSDLAAAPAARAARAAATTADPPQTSLPVLVHIPKAAGISIAVSLTDLGIRSGKYAWRPTEPPQKPPYDVEDVGCSKWLTPPKEHVRGGFAVVRDPIDRMVAEFCWMRRYPWFHTRYSRHGVPAGNSTCRMFNAWVSVVLKLYEEKGPQLDDCHHIPQWRYASKVDHIIPLARNMTAAIRALHGSLRNMTIARLNSDNSGCVKPACVNITNLRGIHRHFREDYANLGAHFWSNPIAYNMM